MGYFTIRRYTPDKLHSYARRFNWDDGYPILDLMISGDNCALGTALMLYWRGKPHYFRQYRGLSEVPASGRDNYKLLRKIEQGVRAGRFAIHGIAFDPRRDDCCFDMTYDDLPKVVELPGYMMIYTTKDGAFDFDGQPVAPGSRRAAAAPKKAARETSSKKSTRRG